MNPLLTRIYQKYRDLNIGSHAACKACIDYSGKKNKTKIGPLPIFHVGDKFAEDQYRILFVGAVAYGWDDVLDKESITDQGAAERIAISFKTRFKELLLNTNKEKRGKSFEGGVRAVCRAMYNGMDDDEWYEHIAVTNVVKCNYGNVRGGAPNILKGHCAHQDHGLMVVKEEIEILQTKLTINFAGPTYNYYFEKSWACDMGKCLMFYHPAARQARYDDFAEQVKQYFNGGSKV